MTDCTYPDHTGDRSLPDTEFDRRHGLWCKACVRLNSRQRYAQKKREQRLEDKRLEVMWDCTCPLCGETHRMKLFWTGPTKPRKFCPSCLQLDVQNWDYAEHRTVVHLY